MKAKKFPLPIIIIIVTIVLISILTVQEYLSIIGWLFLSAYAVFPYLVYKIVKEKNLENEETKKINEKAFR